MILKQGHTYRAMPHDGKLIAYIYRGGRCYYIANPYSPEATQALKAAFPQYFAEICDYGYAHPQLVPFINEDPMLIVSLVEVGKTRWLVGDGKAYVDSGIRLKSGSSAEAYCQIMENVDNLNYVFGSYAAGNRYAYRTIIIQNNGAWIQMANGTGAQLADNGYNPHRIVLAEGTCYIDDTAYSNNYKITDNGFSVYLFSCNGLVESGNHASISKSKISYIIFNADQVAHFIPMQRTDGTCGMLDIVSLTFHPNANTQGTFTIAITDKE